MSKGGLIISKTAAWMAPCHDGLLSGRQILVLPIKAILKVSRAQSHIYLQAPLTTSHEYCFEINLP